MGGGVAYSYWGVVGGQGVDFLFFLFLCFSFVFCHDSGLFK